MGKEWDRGVPGMEFWTEALRVAKPGAHLLAFGGTRTHHLLICAIEDAGWEIRDCLMWLYGQGFPKSLDISKSLDKQAGVWRGKAGAVTVSEQPAKGTEYERTAKVDPVTAAAAAWQGWGTALKPAWEPIIMARKPLEGTVVANVQKWGTGGINVDGCRQACGTEHMRGTVKYSDGGALAGMRNSGKHNFKATDSQLGRWPANVCLDEEAAAMLDEQAGERGGGFGTRGSQGSAVCLFGDSGGPSRFFYTAKASRSEREAGCHTLPSKTGAEATDREPDTAGLESPRAGAGRTAGHVRNYHPTVKPLALMRWLVRLVTPPGGTVLDMFAGSGTTGRAALEEGFKSIMVDISEDYLEIQKARSKEVQLGFPK